MSYFKHCFSYFFGFGFKLQAQVEAKLLNHIGGLKTTVGGLSPPSHP